jgi:predicted metal-dependent hydrolase
MGPQTLHYGHTAIPYKVSIRAEVTGKVAIHVHPDGTVQVDAPQNASPEKIRAAVRKRARWLTGHVEKIRERQRDLQPRHYISGESHFYLGRRYVLKVIPLKVAERRAGVKPSVKLIGGQLRVTTEDKGATAVRKLLRDWYRQHARAHFERRLEALAALTPWVKKRQFPPVKLLEMKKHWGSCSPAGSIVLNPHLVKAPRQCIDYVILHELCHLKEHNHSEKFWRLIGKVSPEWKQRKKRLDDMAEGLLNQ